MRQSLNKLGWLRNLTADWRAGGSKYLILAVIMLGTLVLAGTAQAATAVWIGPAAGGDFQNGANWTTNPNPPLAGDLAIIGSVNGTVTYSSSTPLLLHTFFTGSNVSTTLDIGAGQTHSTSALFLVGSGGTNQDVTVISGTLNVGTTLFVGSEPPSSNSDVVISGANTVVHTSNASVGSGGAFVGVGGDNATLTIEQGAKLIDTDPSAGLIAVGLQQTNNGLLTVTDPGSSLSTLGALQVGSNNDPGNPDMFNNQAKVLNGGSLTANRMQVGILESGKQNTVTVSGTGSVMNLTGAGGASPIGWRSINNTLIVDDNGLIDGNNQFVVGLEATSTGNVVSILSGGRVNGTGFDVRHGAATITNGALHITQFFNTNTMAYAGGSVIANTGATGTIAFNSGTIETVGADINNGSAFTIGDGGGNSATYLMLKAVDGSNGTHSFANGLSLSSNAILSGSGNIVGNVSGSAGATVDVGTSPGVVNVDGDWDNTGLDITLELDNLATSLVPGEQFDQLNITGLFTHGGTVTIDVSQFVPPPPQQLHLKLIGWGSEAGDRGDTLVSFIGGDALPITYRSDGLYVTAAVPEPGAIVLLAIGLVVVAPASRRLGRAKRSA